MQANLPAWANRDSSETGKNAVKHREQVDNVQKQQGIRSWRIGG
ncbi:hypothetical protein [Thalassomonas haliotis]|nr:hypothetical protein [Thalassomonas haliotis]